MAHTHSHKKAGVLVGQSLRRTHDVVVEGYRPSVLRSVHSSVIHRERGKGALSAARAEAIERSRARPQARRAASLPLSMSFTRVCTR